MTEDEVRGWYADIVNKGKVRHAWLVATVSLILEEFELDEKTYDKLELLSESELDSLRRILKRFIDTGGKNL